MTNPIEQNPINSIPGAQPGGIHQAPKPEDLMAQIMAQADPFSSGEKLLQDWNGLMTENQTSGTTTLQPHQPNHKKAEENGMTAYLNNPVNTANPLMTNMTPGVDSTSAADNTNTGSINGSLLI